MRAYKDADKYPKISFTFDEPIGEADPELQMKARDAYKGIVIRLGQRAGSLQLHVVNATTGEPIGAISWQICRGDHPGDDGYCVSGSTPGDYRLSVPSSAPMSIKITVPNYSEWTYQDSANKTPYLAIAAGEDRTLTVNLQPLGKQ
jgi:hypothetical protein